MQDSLILWIEQNKVFLGLIIQLLALAYWIGRMFSKLEHIIENQEAQADTLKKHEERADKHEKRLDKAESDLENSDQRLDSDMKHIDERCETREKWLQSLDRKVTDLLKG